MGKRKRPLLDLFITHWTEDWRTIVKKGFDILALQRMIDWEEIQVTLVHDGTPIYPCEYFGDYPFPVRQISLPHGGIAAARNWCIDHSTAEWIKWCDCDDMFNNVYSLKRMMDALRDGKGYDLLWFDMTAEKKDGKTCYLKSERDPVLIHNKAFRRSFLIDHDIRYNEELTWCEDSAFLAVMEMEIDHRRIGKIKCEAPIYAWIVRDGSLCNRPDIIGDNRRSFLKRHKYVREEFKKRGFMGPYYTMTVRIMADAYRHIVLETWDEDNSDYVRDVIDFYRDNRDDFFKVSADKFQMVLNAVEQESIYEEGDKLYIRQIDRAEFLKWLRGLRESFEA